MTGFESNIQCLFMTLAPNLSEFALDMWCVFSRMSPQPDMFGKNLK